MADDVLASARAALAGGARELILVGQDTSRWRQGEWGGLERLLAELTALEPAPLWIRLLYLQPEGVDDLLLEALARYAVPYVDVPLQHAAGGVLQRMRRSGDGDAYLRLLERIRSHLPGAAVRSTFIAGFPGETEDEFDELLGFVEAAGLAAAGVFPYDPQDGTLGATLPGQIDAETILERCARLGGVIDDVAGRYWEGLVGTSVEVLVERGSRSSHGTALGRCAVQAPDIDGRVLLSGGPTKRGDCVSCTVTGTAGYDMEATLEGRAR